mmetsp:Transcript_100908/g.162813  ORF Transcript_100908/g.162813 Transcript_100908/m.162813 type:complete len:162 (-) Transcript_100908:44-529(-)
MCLLIVPTLPAASQLLKCLQPLLVVVMSTQVVQVPVIVLLMMAFAPALKVVAIASVPRATCSQCTTMMMASPLCSPFRMPLLVAVVTSKIVMVDRGVTHARLYSDAQGDSDDDESVDVLEAILGHVGQHEDTGCHDVGMDFSVGADVGAVVGSVSMVKVSI